MTKTIQEILEARRDRWNEKRSQKKESCQRLSIKHRKLSDDRYNASNRIASFIPFGQPILVGHHSERRHRRDIKRIGQNMDKSIQHDKAAKHYEEKLANMNSNHAISSDDPDAIAKLKRKLEGMESCHAFMKEANKIVKSKKLTDGQKVEKLMALGTHENNAKELLKPDFCGREGFPSYKLTNNNANMKTVRDRIKQLEATLAAAAEKPVEDRKYPELGLTLVVNREMQRIQIVFEGKPAEPIRNVLKSFGFKWAPSQGAWQRHLNSNGIWSARHAIEKLKAL
jgi:hypothetical protein